MPNGIRAIITTGEVNGINELHTASDELGSLNTDIITMIERMIGIIMMELNCWPSCTESTAEPEAAYNEAYNRKPPTIKSNIYINIVAR